MRTGRSGSSSDVNSDEKAGGRGEDEASETGYCGGGGECSATSWSAAEDAPLAALSRLATRCTRVSADSGEAEGPIAASCDADNVADYRRRARVGGGAIVVCFRRQCDSENTQEKARMSGRPYCLSMRVQRREWVVLTRTADRRAESNRHRVTAGAIYVSR